MIISILTMFNGLKESYSLVGAVKAQIGMLVAHGHHVRVLVSEHCPNSEISGFFNDIKVTWVKIANTLEDERINWSLIRQNQFAFDHAAGVIASQIENAIQDSSVCILHDILYQELHLIHNAAIRMVQKQLSSMRFIAFSHSPPLKPIKCAYPESLLYCDMANTVFVTPTPLYLADLALQYGVSASKCAVVPTAFDIIDTLSDEVRVIGTARDFYKPEFIIVYPARAVASKAHNLLLKFAGSMKKISKSSILVIICDVGGDEIFRRLVTFEANKNGLLESEFLCTSALGYIGGVKKRSVLDLFFISNLMVLPSLSETQGLVLAESASRGNLIVCNKHTLGLEKTALEFNAVQFDFGGANPFDQQYNYEEQVKKIIRMVQTNPAISAKTAARRNYAPNVIYERYLKPILLTQ